MAAEISDEKKQALIAALIETPPVVPDKLTEVHGRVEGNTMSNVYGGECAFALVIGEGQDLPHGAVGWHQLMNMSSPNLVVFFTVLLAMEDPTLGYFYIDANKSDKGDSTYIRVVYALARKYSGRPEEKGDDKLIRYNVKPSFFFHKDQVNDVKAAMAKIQAKKPKKSKKDDDEEEVEEPVIVPLNESEADLIAKCPDTLRINTFETHSVFYVEPEAKLPIPDDCPPIHNKVTFTLAIVKDEAGKLVGYLVRFLIHDQSWNPGQIVSNLLEAIAARKKHKQNTFYRDPWEHYVRWQAADFPVYNLTMERWIRCAHAFKGSYKPNFDELKFGLSHANRPQDRNSDANPIRMVTLDKALKRLAAVGGVVGNAEEYFDGDKAQWPKGMDVFRYHSSNFGWDHIEYSRLFGKRFPLATDSSDSMTPELENYLLNTITPAHSKISALFKGSGARNLNLIDQLTNEADELESKVMALFPADYEANPFSQEAVLYEAAMKQMTDNQLQKFLQVCKVTPEAQMHLNISGPLKGMNKFIYDLEKTVGGIVTCKVEQVDPNMSLFGNYLASIMAQYEKFAKIVQPIISFKLRGCFSVYQRRVAQLLFYFLLYGDAAKGKSVTTIEFLRKLCIEGTVLKVDRRTNAANQTDQPVVDLIELEDEVAEEIVSIKAANKNPERTNILKSNLSSGETTVVEFQRIIIPGIGMRSVQNIRKQVSDVSRVGCSNTTPDEGALASRWHMQLMLDPKIPTDELKFHVSHEDKQKLRRTFQTNQFLVCWIEKSMSCGAIGCREPFLKLFDDVSSRMRQNLVDWKIVKDDRVTRAIEIMKLTARELTVEKAAMMTWHMQGATHFQEPFKVEHLRDVAPHLWCDLDIILLAWTLHSSDFIKEEYEIVLRAMCKVALRGKEWDLAKSPYEYFQEDVEKRIPFKKDKNFNHSPEEHQKLNKFLIDLNYLELRGHSRDEIIASISANTEPHLTKADVEGVLNTMSKRTFNPQPAAFEDGLLADDLIRDHRAKRVSKVPVSVNTYGGVVDNICAKMEEIVYLPVCLRIRGLDAVRWRNRACVKADPILSRLNSMDWLVFHLSPTQDLSFDMDLKLTASNIIHREVSQEDWAYLEARLFVSGMPARHLLNYGQFLVLKFALEKGWLLDTLVRETSYLEIPVITHGADFYHFASAEDLPRLRAEQEICMVYMSDKKRICFSPMALALVDKRVVLDAFIAATMCSTTRPGKRILGWTDSRDSTKFQTVNWTADFIREKCEAFDRDSPAGAVSRFEGIPFKRREFEEQNLRPFLRGLDEAAKVPKVLSNIQVIHDLDKWAATQQHLICGLGPNVSIYTHDTQIYSGKKGKVDYPNQIIEEHLRDAKQHWEPNATTKNSRKIARSE